MRMTATAPPKRSADRSYCTLCRGSGWRYVNGESGPVTRCECRKGPKRHIATGEAQISQVDFKLRAAGESE